MFGGRLGLKDGCWERGNGLPRFELGLRSLCLVLDFCLWFLGLCFWNLVFSVPVGKGMKSRVVGVVKYFAAISWLIYSFARFNICNKINNKIDIVLTLRQGSFQLQIDTNWQICSCKFSSKNFIYFRLKEKFSLKWQFFPKLDIFISGSPAPNLLWEEPWQSIEKKLDPLPPLVNAQLDVR